MEGWVGERVDEWMDEGRVGEWRDGCRVNGGMGAE